MERWVAFGPAMVLTVALGVVACLDARSWAGGDDIASLRQRIFQAFEDDDAATAAELIAEYLRRVPGDGRMIYNAACAACRLGRIDEAERLLMAAVREGFLDFSTMRRDPDLDPMRETNAYRALLAARDAADPILAQRARDAWTTSFGDGYRFETDEQRRLTYATALSEDSQTHVRARVEQQTDHLVERFFGTPLSHMVLVGLARPADVARVYGDRHIHGNYQHQARRLITADADRALQHELVHVLHHAHMDRLGQQHPIWLQEALACLYEAFELDDAGRVTYRANDRDAQVLTLARRGRLLSWSDLVALDKRGLREQAMVVYPQLRSVMRFLAGTIDLAAWYRWYVEHYDHDPTGVAAIEHAVREPLDEIEAAWRLWLMEQPTATGTSRPAVALRWLEDGEAAADAAPPAPPTEAERRVAELYAEARAAYATGDFATAATGFRRVFAEAPDHAAARYDLALAAIRLGDPDTGRTQHARLMTLDPSLASLLANLLPNPTPSLQPRP